MKHADPTMAAAFENATASVNGIELPSEWWALSFSDPDRPTGEQHLGICLVKCPAGMELTAASQTDLNPGGEVLIAGPIPEDDIPECQPRWTLCTPDDISEIDRRHREEQVS